MKELTVILPAAALLLALLPTLEYLRLGARPLAAPRSASRRMTRADALLAGVLTLLYAGIAFYGLGDTAAPESYVRPDAGETLELTLPEETTISRVLWYSGIGTGTWVLEALPEDGGEPVSTTLEQNHVAVLKWNDTALTAPIRGRRLLLFVSSGNPELGELALFDETGARVEIAAASENAAALLDEQALVPEEQTYLNSSYFDEIYHPRTAWEGLRGEGIYEITHPPLGKLLLSIGIALFGMCPFGWRFSGVLFGALMLPVLYALLKRLFGKSGVAACCTGIFALDFMHFAQTRLATIDTYAVFFILLMYYYMARWLTEDEPRRARRSLALCGLFFGLGAASKWTCLYAGAGLGVLWLLRWIGSGEMFKKAFWKNVGFCLAFFVALPVTIYYLSYVPYGRAAGLSWPGMYFSGDYARLVWSNQLYMWRYHSGLVATHPYSSRWWQWVLDVRPILYYLHYYADGTRSAITGFTSPLLCWGGLAALLCCAGEAVVHRDKTAGFIVLGYLAQLLPWIPVTRLTFAYHYFPAEVFLVLALGYVFRAQEEQGGSRWPRAAFAAASAALFALFYPVLSGARVSPDFSDAFLQWFGSWPI